MSALRGDIQITPQEIFQTSTTQLCDLGAMATTGDGRIFRYSFGSGTALVAGKVYQATPQDTTNLQKLGVSAAAAIGATTVTTGSSVTLAANQLSGGVLIVRDGTGKGFTYGIKSNPVASSAVTTFTLSDPIQVALDTTSVVDVVPNLYSNVVIAPAGVTGTPVGVAITTSPANTYTWLQTHGICSVLSDGAIAVGLGAKVSGSVSGALAAATGTATAFATTAITTVDAKYCPFYLSFE